MNITLNLLPKNRKKKIKNRKILKLFVWQEGMLIFSVIFLFGITIGISKIIDVRMDLADTQISVDSSEGNYAEIKKYEEALGKTKLDMKIIDRIQKNNINWVPVFREINKNIPEGVSISSILNKEYKISMTGIAESREQLIRMKSQMEGNECFKEVAIPINDIVLKNDIDFKVDFKVGKNCLIKYE